MSETKRVIIIAGPNGAGKTTLALESVKAAIISPPLSYKDVLIQGLPSSIVITSI